MSALSQNQLMSLAKMLIHSASLGGDEELMPSILQLITPLFILAISLASVLHIGQVTRKATAAKIPLFTWALYGNQRGASRLSDSKNFAKRFGFLNTPKCLLLILLGLTDLLVALFSLTVEEMILFKVNINNSIGTAATMYLYYFAPCIYGVALFMLSVELFVRCLKHRYSFIRGKALSLILAVLYILGPVGLSLATVLVAYVYKPEALYGLSVCAPIFLSMQAAILTRCCPIIRPPSLKDVTPTSNADTSQNSLRLDQSRDHTAAGIQRRPQHSDQGAESSYEDEAGDENVKETAPLLASEITVNPSVHVSTHAEDLIQRPPENTEPSASAPPFEDNTESDPQQREVDAQMAATYQIHLSYFLYVRREQYTLIMINGICYIFLLPYAIYMQTAVAYAVHGWRNPLEGTLIPAFFYWWFLLKSFITPLYWTRKLEEPKVDTDPLES